MLSSGHVVDVGLSNGASAVGICRAEPFRLEKETLIAHRSSGRSGPLRFTYGRPEISSDIHRTFPWARSLVSVGVDYLPATGSPAASGAVVARFAAENHYRLLDRPLGALMDLIRESGGRAEALVDEDRLLYRAVAMRSGIGWRGLSTIVLVPGSGPWTLLGTVVTDLELEASQPAKRSCGTCTACRPACPTGALDDEGLDARRCISTWLQTGGTLPYWVRPHIGRRIYGCDDCLTSCPPGFPALRTAPAPPLQLPFELLLRMGDADLLERFHWWYVPHRDPRIIRRNILIAAGNSSEPGVATLLKPWLGHRSALLRGHAAWAFATATAGAAIPNLSERLAVETEIQVRTDVLIALQMVESPETHRLVLVHDEARQTGHPYPGEVSGKREPTTAAIRAIRLAGISYRPHLFEYDRFPGAVGASEALGIDLHSTVKTIVFETSAGTGVIALINGDHEVSTKTLARHLGVKSVEPAPAHRARKWTGFEFGGTSPFGTRQVLPVVAHSEIPLMGTIFINAGSRGFLVEIDPADLVRALGPEIVDLAT